MKESCRRQIDCATHSSKRSFDPSTPCYDKPLCHCVIVYSAAEDGDRFGAFARASHWFTATGPSQETFAFQTVLLANGTQLLLLRRVLFSWTGLLLQEDDAVALLF